MTPALREYLAIRGRADELEGAELDALRTRLARLRFLMSNEERWELDLEPEEAAWLRVWVGQADED